MQEFNEVNFKSVKSFREIRWISDRNRNTNSYSAPLKDYIFEFFEFLFFIILKETLIDILNKHLFRRKCLLIGELATDVL